MQIMSEKLIKVNNFIKQIGLDPSTFIIQSTDTKPIMIDFPDMEIYNVDITKFGINDFNAECGQSISLDYSNKFFYDKKYKVIDSTWDCLIIKISDDIYAKLYKDVVYEWDDCK